MARVFLLLLVASAAPSAAFDTLSGTYFRFGNGFEDSVQQSNGALRQPFTTIGGTFMKLTYSNYPLDTVLEVNGAQLPVESTSAVIDTSGFHRTSTNTGYGIIRAIQGFGAVTLTRTYRMATAASRSITVDFQVTSSSTLSNVKVWFGTRDDYIGNTDRPTKTVGTITNGAFVPVSGTTGSAVQVTSNSEAVILYSLVSGGVANVNSCCSFSNVQSMPITTTYSGPIGPADGSYAVYLPLGSGTSLTGTAVYAAGAITEMAQIAQAASETATEAVQAAASGGYASAHGDPHIALPHGGKADFRGEHKALFNFLSSKDLALNVMTEMADFELHLADSPRHKDVHGSFITQAHIVARTSSGKTVRVSYWADKITQELHTNGEPMNYGWCNGTVDSMPAFTMGWKGGPFKKLIDDVHLKLGYSSLHVFTPEFEIVVTPRMFRLERNIVGLHHRLDLQIKPRVAEAAFKVPPHGIIGQGWDGDDKAIDGEQDAFPISGEFTTYSMAKGAIEGVPSDYKILTPYATDFKYSRFDATSAEPRYVAKLVAAGELNAPKSVYGADVVGTTEITEVHM